MLNRLREWMLRLPGPNQTLFVIAAHVPDDRNAGLLNDTLQSISRFSPGNPVLVVDNASPVGMVQGVLRRWQTQTRQEREITPSTTVHVIRSDVSRGQIGSWQAADALLGRSGSSSASDEPRPRVALLQHSTRLIAPLPLKLPHGCRALELASHIDPSHDSAARRWVSSSDGIWASNMAGELSVPCGPACKAATMPRACLDLPDAESHQDLACIRACARWKCSDWAPAANACLLLSPSAWDAFREFGMWPVPAKGWASQPRMVDATGAEEMVHPSSFSRAVWSNRSGALQLRAMHSGVELLSGMLLAHINGYPKPPGKCSCNRAWCVDKRHGWTRPKLAQTTAQMNHQTSPVIHARAAEAVTARRSRWQDDDDDDR